MAINYDSYDTSGMGVNTGMLTQTDMTQGGYDAYDATRDEFDYNPDAHVAQDDTFGDAVAETLASFGLSSNTDQVAPSYSSSNPQNPSQESASDDLFKGLMGYMNTDTGAKLTVIAGMKFLEGAFGYSGKQKTIESADRTSRAAETRANVNVTMAQLATDKFNQEQKDKNAIGGMKISNGTGLINQPKYIQPIQAYRGGKLA